MYRTKFMFWFIAIALGLSASLAGCGQKGDLYFPDGQSKQEAK